MLAAMMLAFSMTSGAFAAFDVNQAADEVTVDPLTAYTVYLGMPKADFAADFSVLSDWQYKQIDGTHEKAERTMKLKNDFLLEGVNILTVDAAPSSKVIEFNNYFKTGNKGIAKAVYQRLLSTIWMSLEAPVSQSGDSALWVSKDVSIQVTMAYDKGEGAYIVTIRRFNNTILS